MIKKLKISFLVITLSLFVGVGFVNAATTDLNFSARGEVNIGSYGYGIESGTAESMIIGANTLTVVAPTAFVFTSANKFLLSNDASVATVCSPTQSSITLTDAGTVIITPSTLASNICLSTGGGGLSSGGGSYTPPATPVVAQSSTPVTVQVSPTVTMTTSTPGCSGGNKYNTSTGALCVNNTSAQISGCGNRTSGFSTATGQSCLGNVSNASVNSYNFGTTTLKNGSKGEPVMELQRFLNQVLNLGLVVDGKLGPKTIAVIKKWQKDNGLVADGLIGAKTKAKMNASIQ